MIKKDGNPGRHSPIQVGENPEYKLVQDVMGNYYPSAAEVIVRHKKSNTYWRALYAVGKDDSDANLPTTWTQVKPKKVTIVKYEKV